MSEAAMFKSFCKSSTFSYPIVKICPQDMINRITAVGMILGMSIYLILCQIFAPSTVAASCNSWSTAASAEI